MLKYFLIEMKVGVIAGMKKLHEEQKKLQASNLKIEKMIGDIQRTDCSWTFKQNTITT